MWIFYQQKYKIHTLFMLWEKILILLEEILVYYKKKLQKKIQKYEFYLWVYFKEGSKMKMKKFGALKVEFFF